MKFPILLTVWIICDIYLSASAQTSKDEQTVSPVQLKEVPACRSQDIPQGVQEWQSLQSSPVTLEWSYGNNVSFPFIT